MQTNESAGNERNEKPAKITVLIADDHTVVREGLAALVNLEDDMQVVAQAADGRQAVELWGEFRPDVAMLDLKMPILDGIGASAALRRLDANARIIILTTFDGDEDIYRALRAGASGYLLKDVAPDDLLKGIRKIAAGGKNIAPEMMDKLATRIGGNDLTSRETEILNFIVDGKSNQEIAAAVYIAESTVKFHVNNIFSKLGVTDRTHAVVVAVKRGLARI